MPELTPQQKEHLKMAHRSRERISETWSLFTMYLSDGKQPAEALELARAAVEVWGEWQDSAEVEPPDIEQSDFGDDIRDLIRRANPKGMMATERGVIFAAEGTLDPKDEPAATPNTRTSDPSPAADPNSNT